MRNEQWVVVDIETSGLCSPISVVEIAAQKMCGWTPVDQPFRVLLNHDVPIESGAEALHGYSREYLKKVGLPPFDAHDLFLKYVRDLPVVSYNLGFDWDRGLLIEYERLHLPTAGCKGFCAMMLARRTIPEAIDYKLDTLKKTFAIETGPSHKGSNDVAALVELITRFIQPRLVSGGVEGWDAVKQFSQKTPVAKCHELLGLSGIATVQRARGASTAGRKKKSQDNESSVRALARDSNDVKDIQKDVVELMGICGGIMADGRINDQEYMFLRNWLISTKHSHAYPINIIADKIEQISEDGVFTSTEHEELLGFLKDKLEMYRSGADMPLPIIRDDSNAEGKGVDERSSHIFMTPQHRQYEVVNLEQGTDEWLKWRKLGIGASDAPVIMGENPWKETNDLLLEKAQLIEEKEPSAAMKKGTMLEPIAREAYVKRTGIEVFPVCLQHKHFSWMRASLDGMSKNMWYVVEIKCGTSSFKEAAQRVIPQYYRAQLQHILQVTGLLKIDYWAYQENGEGILLTVPRDETYIARLLEEEKRFWQNLKEIMDNK